MPFGENITKSLQHPFNGTKEKLFFKVVFYIKMSYTCNRLLFFVAI